ncbi:2,3-bisphosphoglycerate-independent phosphoglycerate mutase [Marinobacter salicampi]|uniref:2,3-bisphosphoglycerate-independent phosphoglycerate mutase n=1 Tax=Marinobacter salicampi TaxID=435907 RepID=UPI001409D4E7|nr:2,3-bisphosphoglycerate-independent phosphoglycerate mutase [Marinobacter salicampi]
MTDRSTKVLVILDGWGNREESENNAIAAASTPVWDSLVARFPHSRISTSGGAVGLPDGQMGNSEVGHMNLGAGRTVFQNFTRINNAIADGSFYRNGPLTRLVDSVAARQSTLHILGLLSPGGVHSHVLHIEAMCRLAQQRGLDKVVIHGFLDGRDTPPRQALETISEFESGLAGCGQARLGSVVGRYFAMDRDKRWNRTEATYRLLTEGSAGFHSTSATDAVRAAYERGENDEFVQATVIGDTPWQGALGQNDGVVFMNFRPDRARQLTRALVDPEFDGFERAVILPPENLVTLTEYAGDIHCPVAFPPQPLTNSLGEVMSANGYRQLRIAETEKYAHVTFFFNGGREAPFEGKERILVPSPDVASYDLQPEMSAPELTEKLVAAIRSKTFNLVVCNYANGDMVGHTGNFNAAVRAVEALDHCLGQVADAVLETGAECLVTADHGNVEQMFDAETGQAHTAHTRGTVPLVYVSDRAAHRALVDGSLKDIAPTLLALLALAQPKEMTGHSLLEPTVYST